MTRRPSSGRTARVHVRRAAAGLAAVGLLLSGCGSSSSTPSAQPTISVHQQRLDFRQARQGYLWNVVVHDRSLASTRAITLMHFGQDVCSDLAAGNWPKGAMAGYARTYGMNTRQTTAVIHGAVGFLCPEFRHLIEPS